MDLLSVMERFPDQESCISHLEKVRWGNDPQCPHCDSFEVYNRGDTNLGRIGRWNCQSCSATFKVTAGTIFQGTKIGLQKWFLAISLVLNAKKGLSSHQLSRDLKLNQRTAWRMVTCIRAEMARKGSVLLRGIIEADETYIGGKPRRSNKKVDNEPVKRGRGTSKDAIIGVVERGGKVAAELATDLSGKSLLEFISRYVDIDGSELMTDEFRSYQRVGKEMKHSIINHQVQYVDGNIHTNTIEGFWSLLKRAWYGSHHHYQTTYTPLYVAEACYKYNYRDIDEVFDKFLNESMILN